MSVSIRPFEDADETAVVGVWYRSGRAAYEFLPSWREMTLDAASQVFRNVIRPACDIWVAVHDDNVVAYMALRGSYIDRLYVDPDHQRRGWGSRLLAVAKSHSPEGLELHTHQARHSARRFYESHGFTAVSFGMSPPPECSPDVEYHWAPEK